MNQAVNAKSQNDLSELIKKKALELGFFDCGFSKADFLYEEEHALNQWLKEKRHGLMLYMERNKEKRLDPRELLPGTKSIITVLQNYYPEEHIATEDNFKISKYAYGADYHSVIKFKLNLLAEYIQQTHPIQFRVFVDSAPVLDRVWAKKSGLGWIGKNSMLINKKMGSFFFIGHLFIDIELNYSDKEIKDYCANCTRCIAACPTQAIYEDRKVDANKCISYQTIEFPKTAERTAPESYQNWIFGCDICQDVCPWNTRFLIPHQEKAFKLKPEIKQMRKDDWLNLSEMQYGELFRGSAVKRAKFSGLKKTIQWLTRTDSNT
jgi:epoxyqueuosine reductase